MSEEKILLVSFVGEKLFLKSLKFVILSHKFSQKKLLGRL